MSHYKDHARVKVILLLMLVVVLYG
jgi:hypothetical protein